MTAESTKSRNLIIHLGPPKTGTTTFQYFLQEVRSEKWHYGGVTQPRSGKLELSKMILNFCSGRTHDLEYILREIDQIMEKREIFISEEMLLVHQAESSLSEKLERLKLISDNFNTTFLYVNRSLDTVLPSYYQERFRNLPERYQESFEEFCLSEYCKAFDPGFIIKKLDADSCFKTIKFEDLIKEDQELFQLLPIDIFKGIIFSSSVYNRSAVSDNHRILTKKSHLEKWITSLVGLKPRFIPRLGTYKFLQRYLPILRSKEKRELIVSTKVRNHFKSSYGGSDENVQT